MPLTQYARSRLNNTLLGKTPNFSTPPTIHVALSTSAPTTVGGNVTEPVGGAYARVATAAGDWNAATTADPAVSSNANEVAFPQATGAWGNCTHFVLYDSPTAGNVIGYEALDQARNIVADDTVKFPASDLTVSNA